MKKRLHELRYGGTVIALAPQCETLYIEKCELVFNRSVRFPELLEIYFEGKDSWIFDEPILTTKQASVGMRYGFPFLLR